MLKNSARNCADHLSFNCTALKTEKSSRWNPGPGICPGLPPRAAEPVSAMHPVGVGVLTPSSHGWLKAVGFPIQFRTPLASLCSPSFGSPVNTSLQPNPAAVPSTQPKLIGWPPWSVVIQLVDQPPSTAFVTFPELFMKSLPLPNGS